MFLSALGLGREDWLFLREQILERVARYPVTDLRPWPPWGMRYEIPLEITGRNGETRWVVIGWLVAREGDRPTLVTTYMAPEEGLADDRSSTCDPCRTVIAELDVIELRLPVGPWDAGTRGTVHEVRPDALLVEIAEEDGVTRDLITVPLDTARVVWSTDGHRHLETSGDIPASPPARRRS